MGWNEKYWDIVDRYYWTPKALGLKSIGQKVWIRRDGLVCVPAALVNLTGPLYSREGSARSARETLTRSEEALNDLFDLTFAIAPDAAVGKLLFEAAGMEDEGPFETFGREVAGRYGWGDKNVTQHDGFFVSRRSLLGVEVKLKTPSSADQLMKYLALMVLEERHSHPRLNMGLLFIAPDDTGARFWPRLGLTGPIVDEGFLERALPNVRNAHIRKLFETDPHSFRVAASRLRLSLISWTTLHDSISHILVDLDYSQAGDQTLHRLLSGFRDQLEAHADTGIALKVGH